jgi:UDP-N-acetylmuramoylalanine--D-glutamate ligase
VNVIVLGAAVSGRAAARLAVRLGHDVMVYDADPASVAAALADPVLAGKVGMETGEWRRELLAGVDLVVTSPGIPESAPPLVDALSEGARPGSGGSAPLRVVAELEFAAAHLDAPYVAVTGNIG